MSVYVLNNNDVTTIVAKAYTQLTGETIGQVNLKDLISMGTNANILDSKEAFTETLANVIYDRIYTTDRELDINENDAFYVRADEWGGILAAVAVDIPTTLTGNRAWQSYTSGVSTVGTSTVYLPQLSEKLYGESISWSLPITITNEMYKTAFLNEEGMSRLVNAIYVACRNSVKEHRLGMDRACRNNFIGELIAYASDVSATGIHVIELNSLYQAYVGNDTTSKTVEDFLNDPQAMIFAAKTLDEYRGYLEMPSVLFNVGGKDRFIPKDETVVQVLSCFEKQLEYGIKSDVYHNNIVSLPNHRTVPAWQGFGTGTTFDELSEIKIKTSSNSEVDQKGVVAFMCHPLAIMHTIQMERVYSQLYGFENLVHTEYQFKDVYANNTDLPALVFTLEDYTVTPANGGGES